MSFSLKNTIKFIANCAFIYSAVSIFFHANAHPTIALGDDPLTIRAVLATRDAIEAATVAKDANRLKTLYADDFTHTHGSGKVDRRDARIVSLLTAEPTIEMIHPDEMVVQTYSSVTAIVRGKSPILNVKENQFYQFRWVQVFVKLPAGWKLAMSQATRLPDAPVPNKATTVNTDKK